MRKKILTAKLLAKAISLAFVAGCSSGSHLTPAPQSAEPYSLPRGPDSVSRAPEAMNPGTQVHSWVSDAAAVTTADFVSDFNNEDVDIINPKTKALIGQIKGLSNPEGLASNPAGTGKNLYEVDQGTQSIHVYAPPYTGTPKIIPDTNFFAIGIHVDSHGNIFVANQSSGGGSGNGNAIEYVHGSTTHKVLPGGPAAVEFVTVDSKGNVWGDGFNSLQQPEIGYWPLVSGTYHTFRKQPIALKYPGGLAFDNKGNLLLDDQQGAANLGSIIHVYAPGKFTPSRSITIQTNGSQIETFALHDAENEIIAANTTHGYVKLISYPSGSPLGFYFPPVGVFIGSASIPEPGP